MHRDVSRAFSIGAFAISSALLAAMWSVLLWSAGGLSVKSYETFDGAEFEALAAAAQILLFFCLVPAQLTLLEYVGIDWREALRCYRGYVKDGKSFKGRPARDSDGGEVRGYGDLP